MNIYIYAGHTWLSCNGGSSRCDEYKLTRIGVYVYVSQYLLINQALNVLYGCLIFFTDGTGNVY